MKKTHLSLDNRMTIVLMLPTQQSFKQIALSLGKSPSSISREVRNHLEFKRTGGYGRAFNACRHRKECEHFSLCSVCNTSHKKRCRFCEKCNYNCPDFEQEQCVLLDKPPYVYNGCPHKNKCTLEKRFYTASFAEKEYREVLFRVEIWHFLFRRRNPSSGQYCFSFDTARTIVEPHLCQQQRFYHGQ